MLKATFRIILRKPALSSGLVTRFSRSGFVRCLSTNVENGATHTSSTNTESSSHEIPIEDLSDPAGVTRSRVLRSALQFVPEHGWTQKTLSLGAEAEGLPSVAHGMFPRGGIELVNFFYVDSNQQLSSKLEEECHLVEAGEKEKKKVSVFVRDAVVTRISMITPYINTWPQAMGLMALPQNTRESLGNLAALVDDIWYYAGDRSSDMNWYSKRLSLAAVYKSTELFMLQDSSPNHQETWHFLDRRLKDLATFGNGVRNVEQSCAGWDNILTGAITTGRNMLGMNTRYR